LSNSYLNNLISFKFNKKYRHITDITLNNTTELSHFSEVKIGIFLYPFNRNVNSDSFVFTPYEEYNNDIIEGRKSAYQKISKIADKLFGFVLATFILIIFALIKPSEIYSIESIVSILAALAIGKELWKDIDNALTGLTRYWPIIWKADDFTYIRKSYGNLERFAKFARLKRYGQNTILAKKMNMITNSNSKSIKLLYVSKQFKELSENSTRIASIHFSKDLELKGYEDYMFVLHLTTSRRKLIFKYQIEYFQCFLNNKIGSINKNNEFKVENITLSKSLNFGKFKMHLKNKELHKDLKLMNFS
jgi:plasmid maintenance system killer protein